MINGHACGELGDTSQTAASSTTPLQDHVSPTRNQQLHQHQTPAQQSQTPAPQQQTGVTPTLVTPTPTRAFKRAIAHIETVPQMKTSKDNPIPKRRAISTTEDVAGLDATMARNVVILTLVVACVFAILRFVFARRSRKVFKTE